MTLAILFHLSYPVLVLSFASFQLQAKSSVQPGPPALQVSGALTWLILPSSCSSASSVLFASFRSVLAASFTVRPPSSVVSQR